MEQYVRRFIRSSLIWLGVGVTIGVAMTIWPYNALAYRPAHVHANLLGFVSMMIFGVAYHVLPRFTGRGLYSTKMAQAHLILANAGLLLMVTGFIARISYAMPGNSALGVGGVTSAIGALLFIVNIWKTLEPGGDFFTPLGHKAPTKERIAS